jgi:hypothetical protein
MAFAQEEQRRRRIDRGRMLNKTGVRGTGTNCRLMFVNAICEMDSGIPSRPS